MFVPFSLLGNDIKVGNRVNSKSTGFQPGQVDIGRQLRGGEERLILEGVTILSRSYLLVHIGHRPVDGKRSRTHTIPDSDRFRKGLLSRKDTTPDAGESIVADGIAQKIDSRTPGPIPLPLRQRSKCGLKEFRVVLGQWIRHPRPPRFRLNASYLIDDILP